MKLKQLLLTGMLSISCVYAVETTTDSNKVAQTQQAKVTNTDKKTSKDGTQGDNYDFGDYTYVKDMVTYVNDNKPVKEGTRTIMPDTLLVFDGIVMSLPKAQKTDYLQEAMAISQISPRPLVEDGMFIKVGQKADGSDVVIPVYVDKSVVDAKTPNNPIKVNQKMRFAGFHIYNYSKGPAIVVESAVVLKQ